jgi:hypothetical protein
MRCRHTVPDWHRYVAAGEEARAIFAACRLLVKEGESVADARGIACAYWGRQRDCPLYDGPEAPGDLRRGGALAGPAGDVPVGPERVWPVQGPGETDTQRLLLLVLGGFSIAVLGCAVVVNLATLGGTTARTGYVSALLIAGGLSLATHILTLLRLWVRR